MKITGQFSDSIRNIFKEGSTQEKIIAGVTSPRWGPALITSGVVEGTFDAINGATDAIGKIAGSTGDVTFDKIRKLEEIRGSLPSGQNIQVRFEKNTYKFETAIKYLKDLDLKKREDQEKAKKLASAINKALEDSN